MSYQIGEIYRKIRETIRREYPDITEFVEEIDGKVRVHLADRSHLDIWLSRKIPNRYAYHWEHRHLDGGLHRHDNRPHENLKFMKTFPKHFHDGEEENVKESSISDDPIEAVREFLDSIRTEIKRQR